MSEPVFSVTRVLDAPLATVWKTFSQKEHLARWWGPKGFVWVSATLDFRPGGRFHYCMRSHDGNAMWGKFDYREITPHKKIVFTNSFSNANGETVRAPFAANFPLAVLNTIAFSESGGKTTLAMTGTPLDASDGEREFFRAMFPSMNQGFNGTFDQLDAYLAEIKR